MRLYNFFSAGFEMRKHRKSATSTLFGLSGPGCGISRLPFAHEFVTSLSYGNFRTGVERSSRISSVKMSPAPGVLV
jgi:hypothetical protein